MTKDLEGDVEMPTYLEPRSTVGSRIFNVLEYKCADVCIIGHSEVSYLNLSRKGRV